MPIVRNKKSEPCPVNFGLTEASARVIMDPRASERTITYATNIVDKIGDPIFDDFVGQVIRDPTGWTIELANQATFGQALARYSRNQLKIQDITTSHSIKNPKEILLTIELGPN